LVSEVSWDGQGAAVLMIDSENSREARRQFPLALLGGLVVVLIVAGAAVMMSKSVHVMTPPAPPPMAFGPPEQAYAPKIHYNNIQLSKSSNMLNQQFIYINGTVSNSGDKTIKRLQVSVDFCDDLANKHVALHQDAPAIQTTDGPLEPGHQRDFSVTIDGYPKNWNQQMPLFHTSGLVLQ
jgi:hypothetical protein